MSQPEEDKKKAPYDILQSLIFFATMDGGKRYRNLDRWPVGSIVGKLTEESREVLRQLKSDDISSAKVPNCLAGIDCDEYYQDQETRNMLMKFDRKILKK